MKFIIVIVLSLLGIAGSTGESLNVTLPKFMVKLEIAKPSGCMVCSGSFIFKNWILTAGHCIEDANSLVVYSILNKAAGYTVNKTDFFTRTYIYWSERRHDIALIRFPYNEPWGHISPARLPIASDLPSAYHGKKATFLRFDSVCTGNSSVLHGLMYLTIVEEQSCTIGTRFFFDVPLREEHLCSRTRRQNLCESDSSAHLILKNSNELVAILSQPEDKPCSELIFSRISYYTKFIEIVTGIDLPGGGWNRRNGMEQNNLTLQEKLNFAKLQNN